jgi:hypothetical protein
MQNNVGDEFEKNLEKNNCALKNFEFEILTSK